MKFIFLILFALLFSVSLYSEMDKSIYYTFGEQFYAEGHLLPSKTNDSVRIAVFFKMSAASLTFTQDAPPGTGGEFIAFPNVEIAFRDSLNIIRKRVLWQDTVYAINYEEANSKHKFYYGQIVENLPISSYKVTAQLNNRNLTKLKSLVFEIPSVKKLSENLNIYSAIFCGSPNNTNIANPFVLSGNVDFAKSNVNILIPIQYKGDEPNLRFSCEYIEPLNKNQVWEDKYVFTSNAEIKNIADLKFEIGKNNSHLNITSIIAHEFEEIELPDFVNSENNIDGQNYAIANLILPRASLFPGNYTIKLYGTGTQDTAKFDFKVIWQNQPLSMQNIDYAIDMMYYILDDNVFNDMKRGSNAERFKKMLAFWQQKDPTPNTPYNEAMAEYFKRIDYAYFNFSTIRESDGAKTDRGKVYVLYGPPTKTDRKLKTDQVLEIWEYNNLDKVFTFEQVSVGIFKLSAINE